MRVQKPMYLSKLWHSETEMPQNQLDINEEAHIGTEPNIPDDSVNKVNAEPVPNEVQENEATNN